MEDRQQAVTNLQRLQWDYGVVVEDGNWVERFSERLLDPATAAVAGREALLDDEVLQPIAVLEALWYSRAIPRAALAAALREMWLDHGLQAEQEDLTAIFKESLKAADVLMTAEEHARLKALPAKLIVWRGQIFFDGGESATSASWTLNRQVAEWYAAPVPALAQPHGWVLRAEIPKKAILALFLELSLIHI